MDRTTIARLSGPALLAALLSGCGGGSETTVTPREAGARSGGTVSTDLTVTSDDGAGKTETWKLTCDGSKAGDGTHPDPAAACAALEAKGETSLPPVPKDRICTMIYGGPQTAKVTGTWRGKPVDATFSRNNGCEISRWQSLEGLLPKVSGASAR